MTVKTILWHDYETWGVDPKYDRPAQFAAIRTDLELNPIGEPIMMYCRPTLDQLPHPQAALITGISPIKCLKDGLIEPEFIRQINQAFMEAGTCGAGYNSIRFDDEVTRNTLFRNFHDPYEREYSNGNSRWDIIDMLRMARALRPDGIKWPDYDDGRPCFKLEELSAINGIIHENAHDALSDVEATIAVAKLVKTKQPKFYQYLFDLRSKFEVAKLVNLRTPYFLHTSSKFGWERMYTAPMIAIAQSRHNKNAVICVDLDVDNDWIIDASADEIREALFSKVTERPIGREAVGLKQIHLNKCPAVVSGVMIDRDPLTQERLGLNPDRVSARANLFRSANLKTKLLEVFEQQYDIEGVDVEATIYQGFPSHHDKNTMMEVRAATPEQLTIKHFVFENDRYNRLLYRYKARFYPQTLNEDERLQWRAELENRLIFGEPKRLNLEQFAEQLHTARLTERSETSLQILDDLERFAHLLTE